MYLLLVDDIQDKNSSVFVYIYHLCEWSWVVSLAVFYLEFYLLQ